MQKSVVSKIGEKINGHLDNDVFYIKSFVDRTRRRVKGLVSAITRPTSIAQLVRRYHLHHTLFETLLLESISSGEIRGSVVHRFDLF